MVDIAADVMGDSEVDVAEVVVVEAVVVTTAIKRATSLANAPNKDRTVTNLSHTHGLLQEVDDHHGLSPPNLLRIIPSVLYYAYPLGQCIFMKCAFVTMVNSRIIPICSFLHHYLHVVEFV